MKRIENTFFYTVLRNDNKHESRLITIRAKETRVGVLTFSIK